MTREELIKETYTDIQLDLPHFDLYIVRKAILNAIKSNISKFKGNVLDVGCGIMPYRELILNENKTVVSYIGVDFENPIYSEYEYGKPDIFWDGKKIPIKDQTIDTIIATEVFEHCANPEEVMKEMYRVLRPGGILFFTVPFFWYLHLVPYDEYRYTPFALKRLFENSGFTQVDIHAQGGWDASLAQMISMWLSLRPISLKRKKILFKILKPIVQKLIKTDLYLSGKDDFSNEKMITGLWGTVIKP